MGSPLLANVMPQNVKKRGQKDTKNVTEERSLKNVAVAKRDSWYTNVYIYEFANRNWRETEVTGAQEIHSLPPIELWRGQMKGGDPNTCTTNRNTTTKATCTTNTATISSVADIATTATNTTTTTATTTTTTRHSQFSIWTHIDDKAFASTQHFCPFTVTS